MRKALFEMLIKFQRQKNLKLIKSYVYTNMTFYHSTCARHLPMTNQGKKFCAKKRRIFLGHLGIINQCPPPTNAQSNNHTRF